MLIVISFILYHPKYYKKNVLEYYMYQNYREVSKRVQIK